MNITTIYNWYNQNDLHKIIKVRGLIKLGLGREEKTLKLIKLK